METDKEARERLAREAAVDWAPNWIWLTKVGRTTGCHVCKRELPYNTLAVRFRYGKGKEGGSTRYLCVTCALAGVPVFLESLYQFEDKLREMVK